MKTDNIDIHFVGVSGIGLSAVAYLSLKSGFKVSGCSDERNEQTEMLENRGMHYYMGHNPSHIKDCSLVVRSAAVTDEEEEIKAAKKLNIPVLYYSEYLGILMAGKVGIGVAGTHGKTTTTAMLSEILIEAGVSPTVVCGGVLNRVGNNALYGNGDYFVTEACEYRRNFLDLPRYYSIVTNIEKEHLDYYKDMDDILTAFSDYLNSSKTKAFVNADDDNISKIISNNESKKFIKVGCSSISDYRIYNVSSKNGYYSFGLISAEDEIEKIRLNVPGKFNVNNAALAAACGLEIGVDRMNVISALENYRGVKRRLESIFTGKELIVYTDYAHHPTEIEKTLNALRELHPGENILLVFQPHQYSRTRIFLKDFSRVLRNADGVILMDIYGQRDSEDTVKSISINDLFELLKKESDIPLYLFKTDDELLEIFKKNKLLNIFQVIVFMGAGSVDDLARKFVKYL